MHVALHFFLPIGHQNFSKTMPIQGNRKLLSAVFLPSLRDHPFDARLDLLGGVDIQIQLVS